MRTSRFGFQVVFFALLLCVACGGVVQSQSQPFLNRFEGSWQGEGKTMGMPSRLQLKWEWVLGNKFLRLSLRNTMRAPNDQTQVFEGHAYYQSVGGSKYHADWFDSRGTTFPIEAQAEGEALISLWGTPEKEQGQSIYRLSGPGRMEVIDSVRQKDGTLKEFGRFVVTRE